MKWVGRRTLNGGRLEIGRVWIAWRGWRHPIAYRIGTTTVYGIGPLAIFVHRKDTPPPARVSQSSWTIPFPPAPERIRCRYVWRTHGGAGPTVRCWFRSDIPHHRHQSWRDMKDRRQNPHGSWVVASPYAEDRFGHYLAPGETL